MNLNPTWVSPLLVKNDDGCYYVHLVVFMFDNHVTPCCLCPSSGVKSEGWGTKKTAPEPEGVQSSVQRHFEKAFFFRRSVYSFLLALDPSESVASKQIHNHLTVKNNKWQQVSSSLAHHWSLHHAHLCAASLLVESTSHLSSKVLEKAEEEAALILSFFIYDIYI